MSNDWDYMKSLKFSADELLQCFEFDSNSDVLQIGCCNAELTRFLGEHFQSVVCLEQDRSSTSKVQADAKLMENVTIVRTPLHDKSLEKHFDIIFCIGSIEHLFDNAGKNEDSLRKAFMKASELLKPDGVCVFALNVNPLGHKTIKEILEQQFCEVRYYYPFPDYRMPARILSEKLLGRARLEELVAGFLPGGDKNIELKPVLTESGCRRELSEVTGSLFVIAGRESTQSIRADWLGIMYANQRIPILQTVTKIYEDSKGLLRVNKEPRHGTGPVHMQKLILHPLDSPWIDGISLNQQMLMLCSGQKRTLEDIFSPCQIWIDTIRDLCVGEGEELWIDGRYIDNIWKNCIIVDSQCRFFDNEWEWYKQIPFRSFLIRALMYFLSDVKLLDVPAPSLSFIPIWRLCVDIAGIFNIRLKIKDFMGFIRLEGELQKIVTDTPQIKTTVSLLNLLVSKIKTSNYY